MWPQWFPRAPLPTALPEVATLDIVSTLSPDNSAIKFPTMSKVARPPIAPSTHCSPLTGWKEGGSSSIEHQSPVTGSGSGS